MPLQHIRNFYQLEPGLVCSAQPTKTQFANIAAAGFAVVINLALTTSDNALPDEAAVVTAQGMTYHHIPVDFDAPQPADFDAFAQILSSIGQQKCWAHCAENWRATTFTALYAQCYLGWSQARVQPIIHHFWQPNSTWQAFADDVRRRACL